ncbi:hypothetical protein AWM70_09300 [Paenibacillus yonginensis]|uniref:N-acetyltransferase domain-containing protein n=1 Tax=Paenibacillus yonginensis TaxID=1462996 RepID=A0A1B1N014_9BACL|nr:GNAT family N-acetyltransferase [Paenibacillus yonginensis]ANS74767.1 hypothetical protein AWM70_09300 [Paenibacillus yonginensis]
MLNTQDWEQVKSLQKEVEQADGISLKLNWDMLQTRKSDEHYDFVYRENGKIIAFLGLYDFASKLELCGMVAPASRRKGIFRSLLAEALPPERAAKYKEILLNIPAASASGKGFAARLGLAVTLTEYQMKFNPEAIGRLAPPLLKVSLRKAKLSDCAFLNRLDMQGFGLTEEEAGWLNADSLEQNEADGTDSVTYVIEFGGQDTGKIRVQYGPTESWIYGFVIDAAFRGQGIGRSVLMKLVHDEQAKGRDLFLEVALDNKRALQLYQSCGFEQIQVQDYYSWRP